MTYGLSHPRRLALAKISCEISAARLLAVTATRNPEKTGDNPARRLISPCMREISAKMSYPLRRFLP